MFTHSHTHTHTHTHTRTHAHTHIHTHTYIYAQRNSYSKYICISIFTHINTHRRKKGGGRYGIICTHTQKKEKGYGELYDCVYTINTS